MKTITFTLMLLAFAACGGGSATENPSGPFYSIESDFIPSGYMGDINNIVVSSNYRDDSSPDSTCTKVTYVPGDKGFGGVYWQYPANNWCKAPGKDLSGYSKFTFLVKGKNGNEDVQFRIGQDCGDSYTSPVVTVILSTSWKKITIPVPSNKLSNITGAFCWIVPAKSNSENVEFYLAHMRYEK